MQLFIVVVVAIIASVSAFAPRTVARPSRVLVSFDLEEIHYFFDWI